MLVLKEIIYYLPSLLRKIGDNCLSEDLQKKLWIWADRWNLNWKLNKICPIFHIWKNDDVQ